MAGWLTDFLVDPGAGWGWLVYDTKIKALDTTYTMNDDLLEPTLLPILNIDIVSSRPCRFVATNCFMFCSGSTHSSLTLSTTTRSIYRTSSTSTTGPTLRRSLPTSRWLEMG